MGWVGNRKEVAQVAYANDHKAHPGTKSRPARS